MDRNYPAMVTMHGPAFDGTGEIVNRDVPFQDVKAFEAAGYKHGAAPITAKVRDEKPQATADEPAKAAKVRKAK